MQMKSFKQLVALAEEGNVAAQSQLAYLYLRGDSIAKDVKMAIKMFRLAARQKDPCAQFELGYRYYVGDGVKKSYKQAHIWLKRSAKNLNENAQTWLALCYANGYEVKRDFQKAFELYQQAAEKGQPIAQYQLAMCYRYGLGVGKNIEMAVDWLMRAAASYYEWGRTLYTDSCFSVANMRYREALGIWAIAAELGSTQAQHEITSRVHYDQLTSEQAQEFQSAYKRQLTNISAEKVQENFLILFDKARKPTPAYIKTVRNLSDNGDLDARYELALLYLKGRGVAKNHAQAVELLQSAAEKEHQPSIDMIKGLGLQPRKIPAVTVAIGEKVCHSSFGEGVVSFLDAEHVRILFPQQGEKTFLNPNAFTAGFLYKPAVKGGTV